jgi:hypothetical protein
MQARSASERIPRRGLQEALLDVPVGACVTVMLVGESGVCRSSLRRGDVSEGMDSP